VVAQGDKGVAALFHENGGSRKGGGLSGICFGLRKLARLQMEDIMIYLDAMFII